MFNPYLIENSFIFDLEGTKVQVGSVTIKELSAQNQDIPLIIILRPDDDIGMELNFYHSFFVEKKQLKIYASEDQISRIKKVMQVSLFAGEKDWGYNNVCSYISSIDDDSFRSKLKKLADEYYADDSSKQVVINEIEKIKSEIPSTVLVQFRLFFSHELSKKAFPLVVDGIEIQNFSDIPSNMVEFNKYSVQHSINIKGYQFKLLNNNITILKGNTVLYSSDYLRKEPSEMVLDKYPIEQIRDLTAKNIYKLVQNGVAQIGSGDGMAFTPDQDTSCALVRQNGFTFLIDASAKSILSCANLGINVYEDDFVALLTHGSHDDHGAGLYFIVKIRACLGKKTKVFGHPRVFHDYIKKCSNLYSNEYIGLSDEQIEKKIFSFIEFLNPQNVSVTPFNTHSVPTVGFYFSDLNYYITGDMSGAELRDNKIIVSKNVDIKPYYFQNDLNIFEQIFDFVKTEGVLAIESGHPPIHVPKEIIIEILGGQEAYEKKLKRNQLFIYHTSGQKDATDWISLD